MKGLEGEGFEEGLGLRRASRGLEKGFKGASRGLEKGFNGLQGEGVLQGGLKGASEGLQGLERL